VNPLTGLSRLLDIAKRRMTREVFVYNELDSNGEETVVACLKVLHMVGLKITIKQEDCRFLGRGSNLIQVSSVIVSVNLADIQYFSLHLVTQKLSTGSWAQSSRANSKERISSA
jgi:hypothetical protein